jgi:predicted ATPase
MIEKIHLNNFKCFLNSEVMFNQLTILAGSNAVGKSSLIQSLLLVRQTYEQIQSRQIFLDTHNDTRPRKLKRQKIATPLTDGHYLDLGDTSQVISSEAAKDFISITINENSTMRFRVQRENPEISLNLERFTRGTSPNKISLFSRQFYYLNAERLGPRVSQGIENQAYANTGTKGEYTGFALASNSNLKVEEDRKIKDSELPVPNLNKQVEYWLDFIIPGIEISTEVYREINRVGFYLRRTYSRTPPLNPNNVGFGISYVLPIIVSCLLANKNSLIIIENPEAHLHPSGQSRIGQFLAQMGASGLQIIVETHSDHLINGIRIAVQKKLISNEKVSINFFSMGNKSIMPNIEHITLQENADLSDWPDGFFDQEEKDLLELFEARCHEG